MKYSRLFEDALNCRNSDEVFRLLMESLNDSITYWDYFVNWTKATENIKGLEIDLNTLNYLVGKEDVEGAFKELLKKQGSIIRLIPILLACRQSEFKILIDFSDGKLIYEDFNFRSKKTLTEAEVESACKFASKTCLLEMFKEKSIKSVPDYVLGVEVGLDSNGRKNRGGASMERIVNGLLAPICSENNFEYLAQANAADVLRKWKISVATDKASRSFDFVVKTPRQTFFIETNYYSGGGSKLKATAGEYKELYSMLDKQGFRFVWITDGRGWRTASKPLRDTFDRVDYILNINMILNGVLEGILKN